MAQKMTRRRGRCTIAAMRVLADEKRVDELIAALAERLARRLSADPDAPWALVGIRSRGDDLARRLAERIGKARFGDRVGSLDITLYRDDLSEAGPQPVVRTTEIPFDVEGVNIVLVDDVLMSGRSVRAALQSLMDLGRPRRVWLAVLVDRGGRELPIAPDEVALNLADELSGGEQVKVQLKPTDDRDAIVVEADDATPAPGTAGRRTRGDHA
ncbi:MAG: bifunctional pyr operon transcriptional regulator/uracil phosphoribosyltransferase PyrR [Phycisphaeraceae bacterium]